MSRNLYIFLVLILVSCGFAQKVVEVELKKHFVTGLEIADSEGNFSPNPFYVELRDVNEYNQVVSRIINSHEIVYYGYLQFSYAGVPDQLEFIFDTGSSWFWASASECDGCVSNERLLPSQFYD